ncbi:MAG TPA: MipA/OmpV family protein [Holophagaceae bacterium]|nr:MipA/OmpV family protein [Holophagaceae bacterium]
MAFRSAPTLLALFALGPSLAAQAPDAPLAPVDEKPGAGGWTVQLGAMALGLPRYPGSGDYRALPLPVFNAEYEDRVYLGSSRVAVGFGGGVHAVKTEHWTWDLGLGFGEARRESRADVLAGMGDRGASLWAGTGLKFHAGGFHGGFAAAAGLKDEAGLKGTLSFGYGALLGGRWVGDLSVHATAVDAKGMAYDYGVTPDQAAARAALLASGDPRLRAGEDRAFDPKGGIESVALAGALAFVADLHWRWFGVAQIARLQGDAKDSPLVRNPTYGTLGVGFAYRF